MRYIEKHEKGVMCRQDRSAHAQRWTSPTAHAVKFTYAHAIDAPYEQLNGSCTDKFHAIRANKRTNPSHSRARTHSYSSSSMLLHLLPSPPHISVFSVTTKALTCRHDTHGHEIPKIKIEMQGCDPDMAIQNRVTAIRIML